MGLRAPHQPFFLTQQAPTQQQQQQQQGFPGLAAQVPVSGPAGPISFSQGLPGLPSTSGGAAPLSGFDLLLGLQRTHQQSQASALAALGQPGQAQQAQHAQQQPQQQQFMPASAEHLIRYQQHPQVSLGIV